MFDSFEHHSWDTDVEIHRTREMAASLIANGVAQKGPEITGLSI